MKSSTRSKTISTGFHSKSNTSSDKEALLLDIALGTVPLALEAAPALFKPVAFFHVSAINLVLAHTTSANSSNKSQSLFLNSSQCLVIKSFIIFLACHILSAAISNLFTIAFVNLTFCVTGISLISFNTHFANVALSAVDLAAEIAALS